MAKIPESPEQIFDSFTQDLQAAFGAELLSVILYGSGARGEYVPRKSDINFLVVLSQKGIEQLERALDLVAKWRKANVAVPLFLTREYIESALDAFPIEFLNMKNAHKLVHGEDVLQDLEIDRGNLRLQIERELRGKLIHLRAGFLSTGKDRQALREMLAASVPTFTSIFEALIFLQEGNAVGRRVEIFNRAAALFGLDGSVFTHLINVRQSAWRGSTNQLQDLAKSYIHEIKKLVEFVDRL
ncbi:MAG: nucleotidyltransferase domain-containing protein [Calditrichaeota bacterium]|nr:MAG: nucleotidyltransferase domain-containing protein [Calditrichota bacterium]